MATVFEYGSRDRHPPTEALAPKFNGRLLRGEARDEASHQHRQNAGTSEPFCGTSFPTLGRPKDLSIVTVDWRQDNPQHFPKVLLVLHCAGNWQGITV